MLDQLQLLKDKVNRRAQCKEEFERLEAEYEILDKELFTLKIDAHNQQADVDTLNCFSFKNLYYDLTGKKEAMLAKETSEARAAAGKLNAAQFQLDQISNQMKSLSDEILSLLGCETEYWELLQKAAPLDPAAQAMLATRKEELLQLLKTTDQSAVAVLEQIYDILTNIDNIMKWNMAHYGTAWTLSIPRYLIGAQKKIELLRKMLRLFCRKLDSFPLPDDAMLTPEDILQIPETHFHEITGNIGADQRLREADNALHAAKDRILGIQTHIKTLETDLSNHKYP